MLTGSNEKLNEKLSEAYCSKFWKTFSEKMEPLSANFIWKFQYYVDWWYISRYQKLSEDFIREFQDKVDWLNISIEQTLSEEFIREFQDKVNWHWISYEQTLSEDFIREFQNKVSWNVIFMYQVLSENFIADHMCNDYIVSLLLSDHNKTSEEFIRKYINQDNLGDIKRLGNAFISYDKVRKKYPNIYKEYIEPHVRHR